MAAAAAQLRGPRLPRQPGAFLLVVLACFTTLCVLPSQQTFVATTGLRPLAGLSASDFNGKESAVAMQSSEQDDDDLVFRPFRGRSQFKRYEGFVYRRKAIPYLRMRFARWGNRHWPFFRLQVMTQIPRAVKSMRYLERVGWWDPMKPTHSKDAFALKCDRIVYWLRRGVMPTEQVATFLDYAGIIRRTGPKAKYGEWEWRVDPMSGPEAPVGWEWKGIQSVTWGNRPKKQRRNNNNPDIAKIPQIERFGFRGYTRIPIEHEIETESVTKRSLLEAFPNTELPMYD